MATETETAAKRIDRLLNVVAHDALWRVYVARVNHVVKIQQRDYEDGVRRPIVMDPPDTEAFQEMGTALTSALMFERNEIISNLLRRIDVFEQMEKATQQDSATKSLLEGIVKEIKARGPHYYPPNWHETKPKAMRLNVEFQEDGKIKTRWEDEETETELHVATGGTDGPGGAGPKDSGSEGSTGASSGTGVPPEPERKA